MPYIFTVGTGSGLRRIKWVSVPVRGEPDTSAITSSDFTTTQVALRTLTYNVPGIGRSLSLVTSYKDSKARLDYLEDAETLPVQ